jgi:hypothetical protein
MTEADAGFFAKIRLAAVPNDREEDQGYFDDSKLISVATWSARGFTLLAAILTFFGITEGVLDHVLRSDPTAALWIFCLLGVGVVCSILAPAIKATKQLPTTFLLWAVASLGSLSLLLLPKVAGEQGPRLTLLSFLLIGGVVLVGLFLILTSVSVVASLLVLGIAATSFGLYGTTKLAVLSKLGSAEPSITATITTEGAAEVLTVTARAAKAEGKRLTVVANARRVGHTSQLAGEVIFRPDGVGAIDSTHPFRVVISDWSWLEVGYCLTKHDDTARCTNPIVMVWLRGQPEKGRVQVGASLATGTRPGTVDGSVAVSALPRGTSLSMRILRLRGRQQQALTARLVADGTGAASWRPRMTGVNRGDVVVIDYARCESKCAKKREEVARYVVR